MNNLDRFYKLKETYENTDEVWIDHISRLEAICDRLVIHIYRLYGLIIIAVIIGLIGGAL